MRFRCDTCTFEVTIVPNLILKTRHLHDGFGIFFNTPPSLITSAVDVAIKGVL